MILQVKVNGHYNTEVTLHIVSDIVISAQTLNFNNFFVDTVLKWVLQEMYSKFKVNT